MTPVLTLYRPVHTYLVKYRSVGGCLDETSRFCISSGQLDILHKHLISQGNGKKEEEKQKEKKTASATGTDPLSCLADQVSRRHHVEVTECGKQEEEEDRFYTDPRGVSCRKDCAAFTLSCSLFCVFLSSP